MKKKKIPVIDKKNFPYELAMVYWKDIVGDAGWAEISDIKNSTTAVCCSFGWLLSETKKTTIIISDFIFEENGKIKTGGGYTTIPTKNIIQIKKIKT